MCRTKGRIRLPVCRMSTIRAESVCLGTESRRKSTVMAALSLVLYRVKVLLIACTLR